MDFISAPYVITFWVGFDFKKLDNDKRINYP